MHRASVEFHLHWWQSVLSEGSLIFNIPENRPWKIQCQVHLSHNEKGFSENNTKSTFSDSPQAQVSQARHSHISGSDLSNNRLLHKLQDLSVWLVFKYYKFSKIKLFTSGWNSLFLWQEWCYVSTQENKSFLPPANQVADVASCTKLWPVLSHHSWTPLKFFALIFNRFVERRKKIVSIEFHVCFSKTYHWNSNGRYFCELWVLNICFSLSDIPTLTDHSQYKHSPAFLGKKISRTQSASCH